MTNIRRLRGLMNQDSITEGDFDLTQRVAGVTRFDSFAGRYIIVFDPRSVRWYPLRIKNYLGGFALPRGQGILLAANTNLIGLDLFSILPEGQFEGRCVYSDENVCVPGLECGFFDVTASQPVFAR